MKTAVSIPDDVFDAADQIAQRLGQSRSQVYSRALREFIARHDPDQVTAALNAAWSDEPATDAWVSQATRRTLRDTQW
jgi:predicted transcriptional regulator